VFNFLTRIILTCLTTGNRVQWFRAEADMYRWREQFEQKLAEFLRCTCAFGKMKEVWAALTKLQPPNSPGHIAYTRKKSDMYARLEKESEKRFDSVGYRELRLKAANDYQALLDYVTAWQTEENAKLKLEPSLLRYDFCV